MNDLFESWASLSDPLERARQVDDERFDQLRHQFREIIESLYPDTPITPDDMMFLFHWHLVIAGGAAFDPNTCNVERIICIMQELLARDPITLRKDCDIILHRSDPDTIQRRSLEFSEELRRLFLRLVR